MGASIYAIVVGLALFVGGLIVALRQTKRHLDRPSYSRNNTITSRIAIVFLIVAVLGWLSLWYGVVRLITQLGVIVP